MKNDDNYYFREKSQHSVVLYINVLTNNIYVAASYSYSA